MSSLKYKVIKSFAQYNLYCKYLENLLDEKPSKDLIEEMELLHVLIDHWDKQHFTYWKMDPVALLKSLMEENGLKQVDLMQILHLSKSHVSEILSYKKGISKVAVQLLASYFKLSQEAFNRPYKIKSSEFIVRPKRALSIKSKKKAFTPRSRRKAKSE